MNRRELLRLLALGIVGHTLDIDRLLWIPGQKTIFIPSDKQLSMYFNMEMIIAMEYNKVMKNVKWIWDKDNIFYKAIEKM